jgi:ABC-type uncharacterized transport system substrate-binding protein
MKKQLLYLCCAVLFTFGLVFAMPAQADPKPWRVALITGGPFAGFQAALQGLAEKLDTLELIADGAVPLPEGDGDLVPMWQWLAENAGGDYLRFVADAFYSPEWVQDRRLKVKEDFLERLRDKNDIDCVLAFGTWAGQDIALESLRIPVLVAAAANAVEAGIIPSPDDSGRDNLFAVIEPDRYKRQVQVFHKIANFSRLGIVYEDTPTERSSIALREIETAAEEAGVELLRCINVFNVEDLELAAERLRACHKDLVKQRADAVYLTYNLGLDGEHVARVLEPLIKAGLPTFAQQGADLVKHGVMLSLASGGYQGYKEEGIFAAEALEKILGGSLPRSLSQRYESDVSLVVNLRTATLIGWNLPMEILAAVDEFYQDF